MERAQTTQLMKLEHDHVLGTFVPEEIAKAVAMLRAEAVDLKAALEKRVEDI